MENGFISTPQGGPEIKYLLQEGMSGKGSLLAKPSGPLDTSLAWRTLYWAMLPTWGVWTCVPGQESDREQGGAYCLRCVLEFLGTQICSTLPSFLSDDIVYCPIGEDLFSFCRLLFCPIVGVLSLSEAF